MVLNFDSSRLNSAVVGCSRAPPDSVNDFKFSLALRDKNDNVAIRLPGGDQSMKRRRARAVPRGRDLKRPSHQRMICSHNATYTMDHSHNMIFFCFRDILQLWLPLLMIYAFPDRCHLPVSKTLGECRRRIVHEGESMPGDLASICPGRLSNRLRQLGSGTDSPQGDSIAQGPDSREYITM